LTHYNAKHVPAAYKDDNVKYKDHDCQLGFTSKASLRYHFLGGPSCHGEITHSTRRSGHCAVVLDQLPGHESIVVNEKERPVLRTLLISHECTRYDPTTCRNGTTLPDDPLVTDPDLALWKAAVRTIQTLLPTIRIRIIYPGTPTDMNI
jgi:hypothetical protein